MSIENKPGTPKHGDGWRDEQWQSIEVYQRSFAWGDEPVYVEVVANGTKRPFQTANEIRYSWAKMLNVKKVSDIVVVARDF